MTKKNYKLIAEVLYSTQPATKIELNYWLYLVEVFAETLQYGNFSFDKKKFIEACKGGS